MKNNKVQSPFRDAHKQWMPPCFRGCASIFLIGCVLVAQSAFAASWFTGKTYDKQTIPLDASGDNTVVIESLSPRIATSDSQFSTSAVTPTALNLVVSLEADPQGADRLVWVQMMEHFADAIYEATNGAHKLGEIRIFRNSERADDCDIFWKANTDQSTNRTPHVKGGGGVLSGGKIYMYENAVWRNSAGAITSQYNYMGDPENAGYTMAHEMGHYFYGLFDEYAVGLPNITEETVSPSMMNSQWQASALKQSSKDWLNLSIAAPSSGNPGDFENTEKTEQHSKLGASAWEVLARDPANDPSKTAQLASDRSNLWLGPRKHYPELAAAAPASGAAPSIELPDDNSRADLYLLDADGAPVDATAKSNDIARDLLEVIWMESEEIETVIVLDESGSMGNTQMEQAKQAASLLINQFQLGSSSVAVLSYDGNVRVVHPLIDLEDESDRQSVVDAIGTIFSGGSTAIGDGARDALDLLLANRESSETQVVFLLSDGVNTTGENPLNVIPDYQNAQIPLFTFGFGFGADENLMRQLADDTGGEYFFSPTTLSEITQVFESAGQIASSRTGLDSGPLDLAASESVSIPITLDSSVSSATLTYTYVGSASDTTVVLRDPASNTIQPTDTVTIGNEVQKFFIVDAPQSGEWTFEVDSSAGVSGSYSMVANTEGLSYSLQIGTDDGRDEYFGLGGTLALTADLRRETSISGASVTAEVVNLSTGDRSDLVMADDGLAPDLVADDGIYSAFFQPAAFGDYRLEVQASNPGGQAFLTDVGTLASPGPNGEQNEGGAYAQITEPFNRSASFGFSVNAIPAAPSFLIMPLDQEVAAGADAQFTVSAEGYPTPDLQWQASTDGGSNWSDLTDGPDYSGTTTNQLTVLDVDGSEFGNLFRVLAQNAEGNATSETAELRADQVAVLDLASSSGSHGSGQVLTTGIAVTSNVSWSATADAAWITLGNASGDGDGSVTYTLSANESNTTRTGTITVSGSGLSRTYTITQRKQWYPGANVLPDDWRYYDWFKGFFPSDDAWIFHGRHGWQYAIAVDTSGMFLWDVGVQRWFWTNESVYPWMYVYGTDEGWLYFFEGGRPGSRWFRRGDDSSLVSEDQLSSD